MSDQIVSNSMIWLHLIDQIQINSDLKGNQIVTRWLEGRQNYNKYQSNFSFTFRIYWQHDIVFSFMQTLQFKFNLN